MPTILICGDPHGSFSHIIEAVLRELPQAILLVGDMDAAAPLQEELAGIVGLCSVYWIPGNHDTDSEGAFDNLFHSDLAIGNLHGKVTDIGGLRVAGLGGVFRSKIWDGVTALYQNPNDYLAVCGKGNWWRGGLPLKHRSTLFPSDLSCFTGETADLLISHEAPATHPHGFEAISALSQRLQVTCAFHGHHHENVDYPDGIWHGVGLREIVKFTW